MSSDCAQIVSLPGLDLYGPFERLAASGMVNQFAFLAADIHVDGQGKVARSVLAAFTQAVFEATASQGEPSADIVSLVCDFVGDAKAGGRIQADIRVVRRTTSLMFLTADVTDNGRILLTASALAKRS